MKTVEFVISLLIYVLLRLCDDTFNSLYEDMILLIPSRILKIGKRNESTFIITLRKLLED